MPQATDRQRRVLVCDDSPTVRRLLTQLVDVESGLVLAGCAGDGVEAVELVAAEDPDVVVLDMGLPGLRGDEVIAVVRARGFRGRIVVFSGDVLRASVLLRLGADVIVTKGDIAGLQAELRAIPAAPPERLAA